VKKLLAVAACAAITVALFLHTFSASPLAEPAPLAGPLPNARPPAGMAVLQLPTGAAHRNAAIAYRGGSFGDKREFVMTAVLVKHPRGDLLIDTGFGRHIDAHFRTLPYPFRAMTSYTKLKPAADQLDQAGYDRKALRAVILTHAHWDHVSGIPDFPETPVWVPAEERTFIREGGRIVDLVRSFAGVHYEEYGFEGGQYLGFPRSHDVYGDGAVVIVPAPGHTPGSVIVFLTLPTGKRYAMVGDLAWQREGITLREERPWLTRKIADSDEAGVRESLLRMAAIARRFPDLVLVPAHDGRGFSEMPTLQ
jgi:glyoxylase-like metal-dependent hydrolase (beta-lactamase superfamily II)